MPLCYVYCFYVVWWHSVEYETDRCTNCKIISTLHCLRWQQLAVLYVFLLPVHFCNVFMFILTLYVAKERPRVPFVSHWGVTTHIASFWRMGWRDSLPRTLQKNTYKTENYKEILLCMNSSSPSSTSVATVEKGEVELQWTGIIGDTPQDYIMT